MEIKRYQTQLIKKRRQEKRKMEQQKMCNKQKFGKVLDLN